MDLQIVLDALISLIPPALVGVLFYVIMRGIFRADATERKIYAQMEADMREARAVRNSEPVAEPATGGEKLGSSSKSAPKLVAKAPKKTPQGTQKVSKSTNK